MQNAAKNHIIEMGIFDIDNSSTGSIKKDVKERDKENLDLLTAKSYLYAIVITCIN